MADPEDTTQQVNGTDQTDETQDQDVDDDHDEAAELEALRRDREELKRLRAHHDKVLKERKRFAEKVKRWEGLGLTPEEIEERFNEQSERETEEARKTGDTEKLLAQQKQRFERELQAREETLTSKNKLIEELTINHQLRQALRDVNTDTRLLEGAFHLHRSRMKLIEDQDEPLGVRVVARIDDDELPIADYIRSWAETDPNAAAYLVAPLNSGSGATGGAGRRDAPSVVRKPRGKMSVAEKSAFISKYGQEAYMKLPLN